MCDRYFGSGHHRAALVRYGSFDCPLIPALGGEQHGAGEQQRSQNGDLRDKLAGHFPAPKPSILAPSPAAARRCLSIALAGPGPSWDLQDTGAYAQTESIGSKT